MRYQALRRRGLGAALTLGLFAGALGCKPKPPENAAQPGTAHFVTHGTEDFLSLDGNAIPGLKTEWVKLVKLPGALDATGLVTYDPRRVATIVSRVQGRIEDTKVSLWDNVKQGDPILQLYSPDYMTAEAEYLQSFSTSRHPAGAEGGALDGMNDSLVQASQQKLTLLGMSPEDLKTLTAPQPTIWVRAPIGGTIIDDKVVRGSAVNPGDPLFTVGTLDEVWIVADLYEEDAASLAVGEPLLARVAAFPGEVFKGTIANISPDINPDTHTLRVRSKMNNPGGRLKPQMLANVTILTKAEQALAVPQEALLFDNDGYYAFLLMNDGTFLRRKVDIASWTDVGLVRIRAGLSGGDKVAVSETIQLNALWHRARGEGS